MALITRVEFIGLMPTLYDHCSHCMDVMEMCDLEVYKQQLHEYPKEVVDSYFSITEMVHKLKREFGDKLFVDVIDTVSIQGLWKTIKYRIVKTPCVVINGKKAFDRIPSNDELRARLLETTGSRLHPISV